MKYFLLLALFTSSTLWAGQIKIDRVEQMAKVPQPLKILDFKKMSLDFDRIVYDRNATGKYWPLVWIDQSHRNSDQATLGLFTTIGDVRQGADIQNGSFHESLATMGGVLGATLVGIDKSKQDLNYVKMLKNYFNSETGWNIFQNNTNPEAGAMGGGYGRDWWYDVYPNVLFYAIYNKYPHEPQFETMARSVAEKFYQADKILAGNYHHSYFDYQKMQPVKNWICAQPDVAAGHAWVLYSAYKKFKDPKFLDGAKSSMQALMSNTINPSYEVLIPFGALMAARLNAEEGTDFDVKKVLDWSFDGTAVCRKGWGVLVGNWNGVDISGTVGSTVDKGGYGFLMNTYDMAWPLLPMVRYDQRFANAIGKWMLNAANAAKLFYPEHVSNAHQALPHLKHLTKGVIGYEGIIRNVSRLNYFKGKRAPMAQGDGPMWVKGNPDVTQFSVYGSAHVGIFGSIIKTTNVKGILELDLLATDFFRDEAYPTHLYYNPFAKNAVVKVNLPDGEFDLYDLVSGKYLAKNAKGIYPLKLSSESSAVILRIPIGGKISYSGHKKMVNNIVVDYRYQRTNR